MNARLLARIKPAVFMAVLSTVLISGVSALHLATAERVDRNAGFFLQQAVLKVAGLPPPADPEAAASLFERSAQRVTNDQWRVVTRADNGEAALVYRLRGRGLWGTITAVAGVNPESRALTGVFFLEHNETPGLGARISEEWFTRQIAGKRTPLRLMPEGTGSSAPNEIDAVTGATITSEAVRDMLNSLASPAGQPPEKSP